MEKITDSLSLLNNRYFTVLLFIAGAVSIALSLPDFDMWYLAWFALIPLIDRIFYRSHRHTFMVSWMFFVITYSISFYWVIHSMVNYGGMSRMMASGVLLLMALFQGAFPAASIWAAHRLHKRLPVALPPGLILPLTWVTFDYLRAHMPCGFSFPWNSLGQSQHSCYPLLQNAEWGSYFGLSFLIVLFNASLLAAVRRDKYWKPQWVIAVAFVSGAFLYGLLEKNEEITHPQFTVGIVQGNLDLNEKWVPENRIPILKKQLDLSRTLLSDAPDMFLWSESALPFVYRYAWRYQDEEGSPGRFMAEFIEEAQVPLLTGTLDKTGDDVYNAAVLALNGGRDVYYYKERLVPFGEFVPLEKLFFFVQRMVESGIGTFARGSSADPIRCPDGPQMAITICYENIFPDLIRQRIQAGGEVIINITNDAWFGNTSASMQLFAASRFRAVETHRPVIRCANTGMSGAIDANGNVLAKTNLFEEKAFIVSVYPSGVTTLYTKFGDWFALGCVMFTFLLYIGTLVLPHLRRR